MVRGWLRVQTGTYILAPAVGVLNENPTLTLSGAQPSNPRASVKEFDMAPPKRDVYMNIYIYITIIYNIFIFFVEKNGF